MAYTYNKPDATDTISSSQSVLKDNFTAIKSLVDINHVTFGDPDEGKHTKLVMPKQTTFPATAATEWSLFSALDLGGVNTQLFLRNNSSAATITNDINLTGASKTNTAGWCVLPCGIIMKWGLGSGTFTTSGSAVDATDLAYGTGVPTITTLLTASVNITGTYNVYLNFGGTFNETAHTVSVYGFARSATTSGVGFKYLILGV